MYINITLTCISSFFKTHRSTSEPGGLNTLKDVTEQIDKIVTYCTHIHERFKSYSGERLIRGKPYFLCESQ